MKNEIEKMGFEKNKRIIAVYNNQPSRVQIGYNDCSFRSKLEYKWALYLEWLLQAGEIDDWQYEPKTFSFQDLGYERGPFMYIPDFQVTEKDGSVVWHECKGHHDGQTNTKLQRMAKHYPDETIDLVLQNIPKRSSKGARRREIAKKYARRLIDASEIFRQLKGVVY